MKYSGSSTFFVVEFYLFIHLQIRRYETIQIFYISLMDFYNLCLTRIGPPPAHYQGIIYSISLLFFLCLWYQ